MVSLIDLVPASSPPPSLSSAAHVHVEHEDFFVFSPTVPTSKIGSCEVLEKLLPGRLGTYVLPSDAVLVLTSQSASRSARSRDAKEFLERERTLRAAGSSSSRVADVPSRIVVGNEGRDVNCDYPSTIQLLLSEKEREGYDIDCDEERSSEDEDYEREEGGDEEEEEGMEGGAAEDDDQEGDPHVTDSESERDKSDEEDDRPKARCLRAAQKKLHRTA